MRRILKALAGTGAALLILLAGTVRAQTQGPAAAAPPPPPCTTREHGQFDFWLGTWNAHFVNNNDAVTGVNRITRILAGCVISENFDGAPGSPLKGLSYSVYDRNSGRWKQTWVDNSGAYLDFTGGWEGDRMVLSRSATRQGKTFLQRMVWFDIKPDVFAWHWERSDDEGKTWQINWKIEYRRLP